MRQDLVELVPAEGGCRTPVPAGNQRDVDALLRRCPFPQIVVEIAGCVGKGGEDQYLAVGPPVVFLDRSVDLPRAKTKMGEIASSNQFRDTAKGLTYAYAVTNLNDASCSKRSRDRRPEGAKHRLREL